MNRQLDSEGVQQCLHLRTVDTEDGFEVCLACGLVLAEQFSCGKILANADIDFGFRIAQVGGACTALEDICRNNHISWDVLKTAIQLYDTMNFRLGNVSSKTPCNVDDLVASALFQACLLLNVPRTPQDISDMCGIPIQRFWKIADKSKIDDADLNNTGCYVRKACQLLGFDYATTEKTMEKLNEYEDHVFMGAEKPQTKAAVIVHQFCQVLFPHITRQEIAKVCDVTEKSLKKTLQASQDLLRSVRPIGEEEEEEAEKRLRKLQQHVETTRRSQRPGRDGLFERGAGAYIC